MWCSWGPQRSLCVLAADHPPLLPRSRPKPLSPPFSDLWIFCSQPEAPSETLARTLLPRKLESFLFPPKFHPTLFLGFPVTYRLGKYVTCLPNWDVVEAKGSLANGCTGAAGMMWEVPRASPPAPP